MTDHRIQTPRDSPQTTGAQTRGPADVAFWFTCPMDGYDAPIIAGGAKSAWGHAEVRACSHCHRRYVIRTTVIDATADHEAHWRKMREVTLESRERAALDRSRETIERELLAQIDGGFEAVGS